MKNALTEKIFDYMLMTYDEVEIDSVNCSDEFKCIQGVNNESFKIA